VQDEQRTELEDDEPAGFYIPTGAKVIFAIMLPPFGWLWGLWRLARWWIERRRAAAQ
jgi:hypothetical protein